MLAAAIAGTCRGLAAAPAQTSALVFLGDSNLPPYEYLDDDVAKGANVELLQELGRVLGRPVEVRLMQWSEAQAKVRAGEGDALTMMVPNDERRQIYAFSEPTFSATYSFFVRTRDLDRFAPDGSLPRSVAVQAGSFPAAYLSARDPNLSLLPVPSGTEGMRLLLRGEVDAVAALTWTGNEILADLQITSVQALPQPFSAQVFGIAVPQERAALLTDINDGLRRLKADGSFERIIDRWAGERTLSFSRREVWVAGIALGVGLLLLLVIAGLLFASQSRRRALVREVEHRRRTEAELRESESRFRTMADNAPVMIWMTAPDGRFTFLSRSWYDFTGLLPDSGLGMGWLAPVHPDDRERARETLAAAVARREALQADYRLRHADGSWRWVLDAAAPRLDKGGTFLGYIGSMIDISERKQAEERQSLLMREVNHRAKNALAVVQALVRLTRADSMKGFVEAVEGRVAALARAHNALAAGHWTGAPLRRLIGEELARFLEPTERVVVTGPEVTLASDAVQPLAMILHELTTNAVKHGALSTQDGRVAVRWSLEADRGLRLSWQEQGGPPVGSAPSAGFGSTLIARCANDQLGGQVQFDWRPEGLRAELVLPAGKVERDSVAGGPERPPPPAAAETTGDAAAVLIVEDEALVALELEAAVKALGYRVIGPAAREEEAMSLLQRATPDAALLDINLAGRSVVLLALHLTHSRVPVMFCSGYSDRDSLPAALRDAPLLSKPVDRAALAAALQQLLAGRPAGGSDVHPLPVDR